MLWVTRRCIRVNRTATGWLVRRFVDPAATFRFIDPAEVAAVERADRAIGFDAPDAHWLASFTTPISRLRCGHGRYGD
jgi:hypothetical protein